MKKILKHLLMYMASGFIQICVATFGLWYYQFFIAEFAFDTESALACLALSFLVYLALLIALNIKLFIGKCKRGLLILNIGLLCGILQLIALFTIITITSDKQPSWCYEPQAFSAIEYCHLCSNRHIIEDSQGTKQCALLVCPQESFRDANGNCYHCDYIGPLSISQNECAMCPQRVFENDHCILDKCPKKYPLKNRQGWCLSCDIHPDSVRITPEIQQDYKEICHKNF